MTLKLNKYGRDKTNQHLRPPVIKLDFFSAVSCCFVLRYDCQVKFPFIKMFFRCFPSSQSAWKNPEIIRRRIMSSRWWLRVSETIMLQHKSCVCIARLRHYPETLNGWRQAMNEGKWHMRLWKMLFMCVLSQGRRTHTNAPMNFYGIFPSFFFFKVNKLISFHVHWLGNAQFLINGILLIFIVFPKSLMFNSTAI